jgi:hypothetical protein
LSLVCDYLTRILTGIVTVAGELFVSDDDGLGLTNGECEVTLYANELRSVEPFAVGRDCKITMRNVEGMALGPVGSTPFANDTVDQPVAFQPVVSASICIILQTDALTIACCYGQRQTYFIHQA